jgi:hypothetical protein
MKKKTFKNAKVLITKHTEKDLNHQLVHSNSHNTVALKKYILLLFCPLFILNNVLAVRFPRALFFPPIAHW